jgi:hypothetical protein
MTRTLLLLFAGIVVCLAAAVVAFVLKLTVALILVLAAGAGVLALGVWAAGRGFRGGGSGG